ncbi:PREDICTED: monocarboxylate transporter 10 [Ceratosolen solmsi marchali]|uniref:Monocarboxylate transporter 10 n=1 Tax=Ceratosolen solmsi marchali TaxID=326594 RepID=A0AAJ6YGY3_9HYME|nr:PREDICTED: monocarboxylate transporter 10 [Ceratosolen solmsi marchali]XP_011497869.1 PREDICTED: monocarboxylate transporter 10 [Ceratosolen solmsi marchali]
MSTANVADGEHPGLHQGNGSARDHVPLNEPENGDKKPFTRSSHTLLENGRTMSMSVDSSTKAAEADATRRLSVEPPDGGLRAWSIMVGSFLINGVLFSIINTYSLIYLELQKRLKESGETEVSSKAALVGSLTIGTTFFLSPVAGILTDKIGIQLTTFLGGALAVGGMYLSSLLVNQVEYLCLTYGVMYGLGASLAYTPSLVILGHYFKRHLGLVNGIVTMGSSVFTILLPYAMELMLDKFGLEGTFKSLAVLTTIVMLCAILFKPVPLYPPYDEQIKLRKKTFLRMLKEAIKVSIWKKKKYVVWAGAIPIALFGYFVPYVHIGKFVETSFQGVDKKLPVMCIGITSGIGRLIFGYIADLPKVNRILLQQISFISIGILTMLLSSTKSFSVLLVISLCMGLFDGCFISLLGPIAFDICGQKDAAQAIGFLLGLCSIPLTAGPPIAGLIYDHIGSYHLPFLLAGIPPIVGALAMFFVYRIKDEPVGRCDDELGMAEESLTDSKRQNGICCAPAAPSNLTAIGDRSSCGDLPYSNCYVRSDECSPLLRNYRRTMVVPARTRNSDELI